tara:strand:- start:3128 stop:3712 length:585 start_codon:yes stop_codon:yes gene_type:complete
MEKLNINNKKIILGSQSPRRKELLSAMGLKFKVKKLNVEESFPNSLSPIQVALFLAKKKANAYKIKHNELLICADTIVYKRRDILGKPRSKKEAIKMLTKISNKQHYVVTGVNLKTEEEEVSFYEKSIVEFKKLSKSEILFYINNYNPLDKAGGYGIQDWIGLIGVKKISGSFYNVMGLPTVKIYENILKLKNK